jgi:hypothetical protein
VNGSQGVLPVCMRNGRDCIEIKVKLAEQQRQPTTSTNTVTNTTVNAAVVDVLGAALYDPVWTSAIHSRGDFGLALAAFGLLVYGRQSPVLVVAFAAAAGWLLALWLIF